MNDVEAGFGDGDDLFWIPILTTIDGTIIRVLTKPIEFLERKLLWPIDIRAGFNCKFGRLTCINAVSWDVYPFQNVRRGQWLSMNLRPSRDRFRHRWTGWRIFVNLERRCGWYRHKTGNLISCCASLGMEVYWRIISFNAVKPRSLLPCAWASRAHNDNICGTKPFAVVIFSNAFPAIS